MEFIDQLPQYISAFTVYNNIVFMLYDYYHLFYYKNDNKIMKDNVESNKDPQIDINDYMSNE